MNPIINRFGFFLLVLLLALSPLACSGGNDDDDDDDITDDDDVTNDDDDDITDDDDDASFWEDGDPCGPSAVECEDSDDCSGGGVCKNTACVDPVAPESYQPASLFSLISQIQMPNEVGDDACCHDVNGDGVVDNKLGVLITALTAISKNENQTGSEFFQKAIDEDISPVVIEFRQFPDGGCGPVQMSVFPAEGDLDHDGLSDQNPEERADGLGLFELVRGGFDDNGAINQFNRAAIEDGILKAEGGSGVFGVVLDDGQMLEVPLANVKLEGAVTVTPDGIFSVDETINGRQIKSSAVELPEERGGMKVSGSIDLPTVLEGINDKALGCACAGIDETKPVMDWKIEEGEFHMECLQKPGPEAEDTCAWSTHGTICDNLFDICTALQFLASVADVSSGREGEDGTTANDGLSFGLRVALAGASVSQTVLAPLFYASDDKFVLAMNGGPYRLNILQNDVDILNVDPTLQDFDPAQHGTLVVSDDGIAVNYKPEIGFTGADGFNYRIFDGISSREAAVAILVEPGVGPCGNGIVNRGEACDDGGLNGQPNQCDVDCQGRTEPVCGNEVVEDGEECEPEQSEACTEPVSGLAGLRECGEDCLFGSCIVLGECGNETLEFGEVCETGMTQECEQTSGAPGQAKCNETCTGYGACEPVTVCGNGVVEAPEVCELGFKKSCKDTVTNYGGQQSCKADCSGYTTCVPTEHCGDGIINGFEECDNPVPAVGDGCLDCLSVPGCFIVQGPVGAYERVSGTTVTFMLDGDPSADDGVANIPLPFPFNFFGTEYNDLWIAANGYVQFGSDAMWMNFSNNDIPSWSDTLNNMAAPFWDDLTAEAGYTSLAKVQWAVRGTAPNRRVLVSFERMGFGYWTGIYGASLTFQMILYEGTNQIAFNYGSLLPGSPDDGENLGSSATVGAENADGTAALRWSYNTPSLSPGMGIYLDTSGCDCANPASALICD